MIGMFDVGDCVVIIVKVFVGFLGRIINCVVVVILIGDLDMFNNVVVVMFIVCVMVLCVIG